MLLNENEFPDQEPEQPSRTFDELQAELEEVNREREQFRSMAQRAQADLINYRHRAEEERQNLQKNANSRLILDMLGVMDDFQRALKLAENSDDYASWVEGIELIYRKLYRVLEVEGVTVIDAIGRDFDPWEHAAIVYQETVQYREGEIIGVIQEGYKLHGKVLRAAQVAVAKGSPTDDGGPDSAQITSDESA